MYSERLLTLLPKDFYKKITVHEHYYLNNEYRLGGIHIDNPADIAPKGFKGQLGRTCSDLSMLRQMKKESNYVFLKNVFDCMEFPEEKSNFNLNQLEDAAKAGLIDKKVYALGGMSLERIRIAKALGFGGSVGAEAPIVLTGSAIGSNLGQIFRMDKKTMMLLVGCGASAAIAGVFKAQIVQNV